MSIPRLTLDTLARGRLGARGGPGCPIGRPAPAPGQRGVAILVAMLAIAMMTALVMDFAYSAAISQRTEANITNGMRSYYLARSSVDIGLAILAADARASAQSNSTHIDSFLSLWATPIPAMPLGGGWANVSIVDDARKLNINQLVAPNGQINQAFAQIIDTLINELGLSPDILPALIDWLDPDSVETPGGAEADYYMQLLPPYMPRNGPMPTIGDLRLVKGIDDATFIRLSQFLTTAPTTQVNINTAPPEVLVAVAPQLGQSTSALTSLLQERQVQPFANMTEVSQLPGMSNLSSALSNMFGVSSDYFTITGLGTFAQSRTFVYATVRRSGTTPMLLLNWHED